MFSGRKKQYLMLHLLMLLFSLPPLCCKISGQHPFLSFPFLFFYGLSIFLLGIYALLWQQVIKRIPLNVAYANKAVTVVWGMIWGVLFFGESITVRKLIGAVTIMTGVVLYAKQEYNSKGTVETDGI